MPSSTSSSDPRRRAVRCVVGVALGVLVTLGFDHATYRAHERAGRDATAAALALGPPSEPAPPGATRQDVLRGVLERRTERAVVFVGNSVIQTSTVPAVVHRELGLADETQVLAFAPGGVRSTTVLAALRDSGWRPALVVVDIGPRHLGPVSRGFVHSLLFGKGPEARPAQARLVAGVESSLDSVASAAFPGLLPTRKISNHARAAADGLRHGWVAYRCAMAGNVWPTPMADGSLRVRVLNTTPAYERFRRQRIGMSHTRLREAQPVADAALDALASTAADLAADGCEVVIVNMPLEAPLRRLDQQLNAERYARLAARIAETPGVSFVDLGADPRLVELPFYDGDHREYDVAIEASALIAGHLRQHVPAGLR